MSKQVEPHVLTQYTLLKEMGSGAYGHVWQVQQKHTHKRYALKKVFDAFRNPIDAQRTYRQVSILRQLNHQNIIKLYKVIKSRNKKDLYLVFEFMQADLHSIVGSNILEKMHLVFVFYQVLKALKFLHSAQLIHRDLKPSNVLLNSECSAKVCDFGLVRTLNAQRDEEAILSQEVATKWYRAPELLLGSRSYTKPIDVWSFGCIVAEMLIGRPMFAGDSTLNQLQKIMEFTGQIHRQDIQSLDSPVAEQLVTQIKVKKRSFREYFGSVDPDFWVLLKGTLEFNPTKRMSIDEILELQLFNQFRQEVKTLKVSPKSIRPEIDDNMRYGLKVYREKIYQDIDKAQNASVGNKKEKLAEIQNLLRKKSQTSSKKRVSSQQKNSKKDLSKFKHRQYSVGTNEAKNRSRTLSNSKSMEKKGQSQGKLTSSHKSIFTKKASPYKPYLQTLKNSSKVLSYNSNSQILSNYYKKSMLPANLNSPKIRKILQPFVKGKGQQKQKKQALTVVEKGKLLKKVSSANQKRLFTNKSKNNILARIGFG